MSNCPEIERLEAGAASDDPAIAAHVANCAACQKVIAMLEARESDQEADECADVELLLAMRESLSDEEKQRLRAHLAVCAECAGVAGLEDTAAAASSTGEPGVAIEDAYDRLPTVERSHYRVGEEVARGGMGRISEAEDKRLGRMVAIKELLTRDPAARQRFKREALVTAGLQHPSIVPVYEAGRWPDGEPFYAMKRVEGRSLRDVVTEAKTEAERIALVPNVLAVAEAMAYAHSKRVIHRDLKPSNILVGEYGETVVIDWGLAKDLASDAGGDVATGPYRTGKDGLTVAGAVVGTPAFMSPEQADGKPVDERTDVYALGAILYHVLGGVAPYRGKSSDEVLSLVLDGPPLALRHLAPRAPRDLLTIVDKAMSRKPAERYPTALEMAEDLRRFQQGQLVAAHEYSRSELVRRWLRRNRSAVVVASVLLAVLVSTGIYSVGRILHERDRAEDKQALAEGQRDRADRTSLALLREQGRHELLAGRHSQALVYLSEAYSRGDDSLALRFLLADAARPFDNVVSSWQSDVENVRFSGDSKRCVSLKEDKAVLELREVATGALVGRFPSQTQPLDPTSTTLNHDGSVLAAVSEDGELEVWEVGRKTSRVLIAGNSVRGLFGADRDTLIVISSDGVISWWNARAGEKLREERTQAATATGAALSPTGERLVVITSDGGGEVWDARSSERISRLEPLPGAAHSSLTLRAAESPFSPDGEWVVWGTDKGAVAVWNASSGKLALNVSQESEVLAASFSPDGSRFVAGGMDGTVRIWDAKTGAVVARFEVARGPVGAFYVGGGKYLAVTKVAGMNAFTSELWDADNGTRVRSLGGTFGATNRDGELIGVTTDTGVTIVRAKAGRLLRVLEPVAPRPALAMVTDTSFDAEARRAVVAYNDHTVTVWDTESGAIVDSTISIHTEDTPGLRTFHGLVSPDGTRMLKTVPGKPVELRHLDKGFAVVKLDRSSDSLLSSAFSEDGELFLADWGESAATLHRASDGSLVAQFEGAGHVVGLSDIAERAVTVNDEGVATLWNLQGKKVAECALPDWIIYGVSFSPDGQRLVFASWPKEKEFGIFLQLSLWDAQSGTLVSRLKGAPSMLGVVAFDAAGRRLAAGTSVWDVSTGARLGAIASAGPQTSKGLARLVFQLPSLSYDGSRFAAGLTVLPAVRDATSGEILTTLDESGGFIVMSEFSRDGSLLVTSEVEGRARLWEVASGRLLAEFELGGPQFEVGRSGRGRSMSTTYAKTHFSRDGKQMFVAGAPPLTRIYDLGVETRTPEQIADLVKEVARWRLEEGRLVPRAENTAKE